MNSGIPRKRDLRVTDAFGRFDHVAGVRKSSPCPGNETQVVIDDQNRSRAGAFQIHDPIESRCGPGVRYGKSTPGSDLGDGNSQLSS